MKRWFVTYHETELPVSHHPYWVIEVMAKTKYSAIMEAQKEVDDDCGEYEYRSVVDMTGCDVSKYQVEMFCNVNPKTCSPFGGEQKGTNE